MARRRTLSIVIAACAVCALAAGPAHARPLAVSEAGELARAAVADRTDELICVRAVGRSSRPSPRRVLCLVGQVTKDGAACRMLVDVRSRRGASAPARARVVQLLCHAGRDWRS